MNQSCNCKIITGQYSTAGDIGQQMIQALFGKDAQYRYELYFHWYNLIHELGHAIMMFNNPARPHPAEEEQLVNDFAVAYWRQYGETAKLRQLEELVTQTLTKFPALTDGDYLEFTKAHWGELFSKPLKAMAGSSSAVCKNLCPSQRLWRKHLAGFAPECLYIKTRESFLMKSVRKWQKEWCQMPSAFCGNGVCTCLRGFRLY